MKTNGHRRERHEHLEQEASAARGRLLHTLGELGLRRERTLAKIHWFELKALPAIAIVIASASLISLCRPLRQKRGPLVIVRRSGGWFRTGIAFASVLLSISWVRSEPRPAAPRLPSPLEGTRPDPR